MESQISERLGAALDALEAAEREADQLLLEDAEPAALEEADKRVQVCREKVAQIRREEAETGRLVV